jgi:DNA-binding response OmpR family regulator
MALATHLHVLLIRAWIRAVEPVRAALHAVGLDVHITRVDLEPALHAALTRRAYDVVIHDPEVPNLPRDTLAARLRDHHHAAPIVTLGSIDQLGYAVLRALAKLRN